MRDPFAWVAAKIYRRPWAVVLFWLLLLGALAPHFAPLAAKELKGGGIIVDKSESSAADQLLADQFDLSSQKNLVVLFHSSSLTVDDSAFHDQVTSVAQSMRGVDGVKTVTTYYDVKAEALVSSDRHAMLVPVVPSVSEDQVEGLLPKLRDQLKPVTLDHYVIGNPAAAVDSQAAAAEDLHRAELVTLPLIIIMLIVVFRTVVAAVVPLLLGGLSIGFTVAYLGILGGRTDISIFALNVGSLIGLGLAIDYCLIILTRFREELDDGQEPRQALIITMASAGRSIAYSALTVVIAMAAVTAIFSPIMIVRSISLAVLVVAIQAALLAMTLLPAAMAMLKHRIEWLRVIPRPRQARPGETGIWYRFSHFVMERPWVWLVACLAIMLGVASPVTTIAFGSPTPAAGTEVADGTALAQSEFPAGRLAPIYVIVKTGTQDGVWTPGILGAVRDATAKIKQDSRVSDVSSLSTALSTLPDDRYTALTKAGLGPLTPAAAPYVNLNGDDNATVITVVPKYLDSDIRTDQLLADLRGSTLPGVTGLSSTTVYVGGSTAIIHDFKDKLLALFPWVLAAVAVIILVILLMFFQSLALPVKAVLLNVLSIAASFGVLSIVFQHGVGDRLLGFDSSAYITIITPGILYVILFALSTDYEVFMLSRVKEYFRHTGNNEEAVAAGLQHTAGIITAAGLILVVTFGSFLVSHTVVLKEIGLGLAMGVLLDSSIVRVVMVPATMRLLGNGNWYMPAWLKRIVPEISEEGARQASEYAAPAAPPAGVAVAAAPVGAPAAAALATAEAAGSKTSVLPTFAPGGPPGAGGATTVMPALPLGGPPTTGRASLVVSGTWDGVPSIALSRERTTRFGRMDSNEIRLRNPAVSRWHARIDYRDGQYCLSDLDSVNGVYVNGVRIAPRPATTVLHPGDFIVIGGYPQVAFIFKVESVN